MSPQATLFLIKMSILIEVINLKIPNMIFIS